MRVTHRGTSQTCHKLYDKLCNWFIVKREGRATGSLLSVVDFPFRETLGGHHLKLQILLTTSVAHCSHKFLHKQQPQSCSVLENKVTE